MTVASDHVFTTSGTQYDLRQAVMWSLISATEVRVNYRGAPQEGWVRHDLTAWVAAKQTSLGSTLAACPHLFSVGDSFWDVRFAAMWAAYGSGVRVYYESANEYAWVDHPSRVAWEAVKAASLAAEGGGGGSGSGGLVGGQTIILQQGLDQTATIATTGTPLGFSTVDPLPAGVTLDGVTGVLSGLPTEFGDFTISLTVSYAEGPSVGNVVISVAEALLPVPLFDLASQDHAELGYFQFDLTMESNPLPVTYEISGQPLGVYLTFYGGTTLWVLAGTPAGPASYTITVTMTNWAGTVSVDIPMTVYAPAFEVYNTTTFDGVFNADEVTYAYYTWDYVGGALVEVADGSSPPNYPGPVRRYQSTTDPLIWLFYFAPWGCWVIANPATFAAAGSVPTCPSRDTLPGLDAGLWFSQYPGMYLIQVMPVH